ncbi:ribosome small subunit-dependent GTPase A [Aegicerativicinus sediminis]|uniref:ribosome small subunit-dependent GTPase A n=1 Tax=Aegicerativicinus sediminis TaxID=2893202 RepID=UPI001E57D8AB|nr:ribosome small subunit-dependent GTPase A [Aegicerativicinus sediminis]
MTLEDLGYDEYFQNFRSENNLEGFGVGRVIAEHKERYEVKTIEKEYEAEILGNIRFTAQSRADFPAVGDWVAISEYDVDKVLIHAIFPRKSIIERQMVGKNGEKQIIATNIDTAFIIQAVDRDFNLNRLERYLTICYNSKIEPVIVLSKIDLMGEDELMVLEKDVKNRIPDVKVFSVSNESLIGIEYLQSFIERGQTYCLLGSSGVGKSSLLNSLYGDELMKTSSISEHSKRGKHVTTHRELRVLKNGGIIIDNPGMREVGITENAEGLQSTFDSIYELSDECKFKDCSHTTEAGCAVLEAVDKGEIDMSSYENYLRMLREQKHFETTLKDKRKKDKMFGKLMKRYKKGNYKNF